MGGREASALLGKLPFGDFPQERVEGQECFLILEGRISSSYPTSDIKERASCQQPRWPSVNRHRGLAGLNEDPAETRLCLAAWHLSEQSYSCLLGFSALSWRPYLTQ